MLLALAYAHFHSLRILISDPIGPIPLGVPWWGALGGVMISLTGVFRHPHEWDDSYNKWHVAVR